MLIRPVENHLEDGLNRLERPQFRDVTGDFWGFECQRIEPNRANAHGARAANVGGPRIPHHDRFRGVAFCPLQRFVKDAGIRFRDAHFLGHHERVDEPIQPTLTEFLPLLLDDVVGDDDDPRPFMHALEQRRGTGDAASGLDITLAVSPRGVGDDIIGGGGAGFEEESAKALETSGVDVEVTEHHTGVQLFEQIGVRAGEVVKWDAAKAVV